MNSAGVEPSSRPPPPGDPPYSMEGVDRLSTINDLASALGRLIYSNLHGRMEEQRMGRLSIIGHIANAQPKLVTSMMEGIASGRSNTNQSSQFARGKQGSGDDMLPDEACSMSLALRIIPDWWLCDICPCPCAILHTTVETLHDPFMQRPTNYVPQFRHCQL